MRDRIIAITIIIRKGLRMIFRIPPAITAMVHLVLVWYTVTIKIIHCRASAALGHAVRLSVAVIIEVISANLFFRRLVCGITHSLTCFSIAHDLTTGAYTQPAIFAL